MFKKVIGNTTMTSSIADDVFPNIDGEKYMNDTSFVATLRALLSGKISDDGSIYIQCIDRTHSKSRIEAYGLEQYISDTIDVVNEDVISIFNFTNSSQSNKEALDLVDEGIKKHRNSWKKVEKVTLFYQKSFHVICYVVPERRQTYIFIDNLDIRKFHYLQCGIPAYLPWYFETEDSISAQDIELLDSLREKTSEKYEELIEKYAEKYNFRELRIKNLLSGFESRHEKVEIENLKRCIQSYINEINNLNDRIGEKIRTKRDSETRLLGLEAKVAQCSDDSEIMEYFLAHKNLVLTSVSDSRLNFVVKGYVSYYDEDMAESMIENETSYIYNVGGRERSYLIPAEDMKMLMKAIFIEQKLRMKFCSAYSFDFRGNVYATAEFRYSDYPDFKDCTPNTHIDRFSCLGNYTRIINERLMENDYIGAIEQCVASAQSLNFGDSCVMEEFMKRLYKISERTVNIKCIELPDGGVVDPKGAIEYLKSQQEVTSNE